MKLVTTDPVCGMAVDPQSQIRADHEGSTYLFCSEHCREKFLASPAEYLPGTRGITYPSARREPGTSEKVRQKGRGRRLADYVPLFVVIALTLLSATAKQFAYGQGWHWMSWMHDFMGFFLVVFSMFKLFNLEGFADGFQMYDLLAKPVRAYAYVYPFIELGLGLGYLAHWQPVFTYGATVVVMIFGSLGVFRALSRKMNIQCACMGTVLRVPLSTVALLEDLGMAVMAGAMLFGLR